MFNFYHTTVVHVYIEGVLAWHAWCSVPYVLGWYVFRKLNPLQFHRSFLNCRPHASLAASSAPSITGISSGCRKHIAR